MIEIVPATGSTNADLAARVSSGEWIEEGTWLIARRQTAGKGRQGRTWFDGAGNFMGSTVVQCRIGDPAPGTLALLAGLVVHEVVSALVPIPHRAMLKWPNDVLIGQAKLAGILLERTGDLVVVGIGVNLAAAPLLADRATIALTELAPAPDLETFADNLARQFAVELERWRSYGLAAVIARWLAAGHPPGTPLTVGEPGAAAVQGSFAGLAEDGALQLRLPAGGLRTIHAGEVRLNRN